METTLQIITRPVDELTARLLEQEKQSGVALTLFDLTVGNPDYDALVEAVFAADRVHVL